MTPSDAAGTSVLRLRPDRPHRLEALLLGAGPHLEPVLDVGSAANGDLLLVLPAPAARLPVLLEAPGALGAGEAVTVLVPLAQALRRLHDAGVAHGGVRAAAVVLDADGSPAWTAPLAPTLLRVAGATRFRERVDEDVTAFHDLGAALLGASGLRMPEGTGLDGLAAALFRVAAPEPVRLVRSPLPVAPGPPARLVPAAAATVPPPARAAGIVPALRAQVRTVRPRAWAGLGAVLALLVGALTLLPSGEGAPAAVPSSPSSAHATLAPTPVVGRAMDAATAVAALLVARDGCLEAGSEACLRTVDGAGSPVLDADLRAVRAGVDAARVDRRRLRVTVASGDTALATAGNGTVLAIRDRNDWRLRDVVAEPPGRG